MSPRSPQSPALPQLRPQPTQGRPQTRAKRGAPSPSQRFPRAQSMPPDLQIAAGLLLAGTMEDKWPQPGMEAVPVSPMQATVSTTPLRYEEHERLRKDLERLAPGSTKRTSPSRRSPTRSRRSRRRGGDDDKSPHGAAPQRPSSRKPRSASMQRLKRGQSITSLQTELLLNQFCEVETFGCAVGHARARSSWPLPPHRGHLR